MNKANYQLFKSLASGCMGILTFFLVFVFFLGHNVFMGIMISLGGMFAIVMGSMLRFRICKFLLMKTPTCSVIDKTNATIKGMRRYPPYFLFLGSVVITMIFLFVFLPAIVYNYIIPNFDLESLTLVLVFFVPLVSGSVIIMVFSFKKVIRRAQKVLDNSSNLNTEKSNTKLN